MANWVGFSDEELRRLKQDSDPDPRDARSQVNARPARGRPAGGRGRGPPRDRNQQAPINRPSATPLPAEARLSQPSPPTEQRPQKSTPQSTLPAQQNRPEVSAGVKPTSDADPPQGNQPTKVAQATVEKDGENNKYNKQEEEDNMGMELGDKDIIIQELQNVEKFQFQQKRIEEQNKKKRELLTVAISERQKKAKQEATRLIRIQKELAQLDHLLAIDVSIIRNKIEESSREYLEAQRRYERAEKEFIESKMDLHHKCMHKDSLTEHLHMVIHQNEVRKARKLTELMEKLSMEDGGDFEELTEELSSTSSAFIIGSLQSTEEQRAFMQRKRNTSESSTSGKQVVGMPVRRSASDGGASEPGSTPGKGAGVTGWISSWILGSPTSDNNNKSAKTESDSDDATFKAKNSLDGGPQRGGAVVTQAPATSMTTGPAGVTTVPPTSPPPSVLPTPAPTTPTTVNDGSPIVNNTAQTGVNKNPETTAVPSVTQGNPSPSPSPSVPASQGTEAQSQNPGTPPSHPSVPAQGQDTQPSVDSVKVQNGPSEEQVKPAPKDLNDNKVREAGTHESQGQS